MPPEVSTPYINTIPAAAQAWFPGDVEIEKMPVDRVMVMVVGHVPTLRQVESILAGWPDQMAKPDGISWVAERLRANGVPATAPA